MAITFKEASRSFYIYVIKGGGYQNYNVRCLNTMHTSLHISNEGCGFRIVKLIK